MNVEKKQKATIKSKRSQKSEVSRPGIPGAEDNKNPEVGGPKGLEPTRYGDWERKGRCIDF